MATQNFKNTPSGKGLRTFVQTIWGLLTGLVITVWGVPGVPEAVTTYARENALPLLIGGILSIGVPAGLVALIQNKYGK